MTDWSRKHPTARTTHQCDICYRLIGAGERYMRGAGFEGATAWTWKECAHCEFLVSACDVTHYSDEYGPDTIADWEPATIAELRLKANWRRQWSRRDGSLVPVGWGETP